MEKVILKRLEKVYCKLAPSNVHGIGIFAINDIPKGVNPFIDSYIGQDAQLVSKKKIVNENICKLLEDHFPTNNNAEYIVPAFPNQLIWTDYLNYTYEPENVNIILEQNGNWVTTRVIKQGEELLEHPGDHFNKDGTFKVRHLDKNYNNYLLLRK
jgi:hypothetical protein